MPLVFTSPKLVSVDSASITSISIKVEPLQIVIAYDTTVGSGSEAFGAAELAAVDPNGEAYEAVKAIAYALLKSKLGAGTVT